MKCGSCGPRRCGGGCGADYSSRADQKPSLGAIDIVDGIFRQALRNMAKRLSMLRTGEMTPEELDAANEKLVFWLASTFSGENRHFETVDEWHPYGLSDELERIFGDHLSIEGGQGDDRTIARAARLFVREGEAMLTEALEAGLPASSAAETEPAVICTLGQSLCRSACRMAGGLKMSGELDPRLKAELENRLREEALGRIFRGLSPEAMRTLRAVSEMRNRSPQDVLRDELEGYILEKLPPVDVEGIIQSMGSKFYQLGWMCGKAKNFIRAWNRSRED